MRRNRQVFSLTERSTITPRSDGESPDIIDFLLSCTEDENSIIESNAFRPIAFKKGGGISTGLARRILLHPKAPSADCIERFATMDMILADAASRLAGWQERARVFGLTWFSSNPNLRLKGHDTQLVRNIMRSDEYPKVPEVSTVRLNYGKAQAQACKSIAYHGSVIEVRGIAIGNTRYDFDFDAGFDIDEHYPHLTKICRPTISIKEGEVRWDFPIEEHIVLPKRNKGRIIGFDRGMDSVKPFTGSILYSDGTVSRELGASHSTMMLGGHRSRVASELRFAKRKRDAKRELGLDASSLDAQIESLQKASDRLTDAMDDAIVSDMLSYARPGDTVAIENLTWSGGGAVKFRHGRTDERLEHACNRQGIRLVTVNAAYTSQTCPMCGTRASLLDNSRVLACSSCGYRQDKDRTASAIIAQRGMKAISISSVPISRRRQDRTKSSPTPRRPRDHGKVAGKRTRVPQQRDARHGGEGSSSRLLSHGLKEMCDGAAISGIAGVEAEHRFDSRKSMSEFIEDYTIK